MKKSCYNVSQASHNGSRETRKGWGTGIGTLSRPAAKGVAGKSFTTFALFVVSLSFLLAACSKNRSTTTILYYTHENSQRHLELLEETGRTNEWNIVLADDEHYYNDDSLSRVSAVFLPYSSLNQLGHRSIPALKRYLEAGGGGIVTVPDTTLTVKGWPWIQTIEEVEAGQKSSMDKGSVLKLNPDYDQQELEQALLFTIGKNSTADYSKATTLNVPDSSRYTRRVLAEGLDEPLEMALLPDNNVLFIERKGGVKMYEDKTGKLKTVANFNVFTGIEDGLLGVAADPDFAENNWIYFYYAVAGERAVNRLSRFDLVGDSLAMASEKVLLEIPTQRIYCCHSAGYLAFDMHGDLYLSTGDNTNAEDALIEGYPPVDERPGRALADVQASAANTDNLKGKILRITPQDDGSYSIPDGNLFPKDGSRGRPEIYIMGVRNPFRFSLDQKNNYLYWGDVGPDTKVIGDHGQPMSIDEINQARASGFYGWPYFLGNNQAFPHYDYATQKEGPRKDPQRPLNDSPHNTGERELPPAQEAMIWYGKGKSIEFPLVGSGGATAMAGPVYYSDLYPEAPYKLSEYYNEKLIIYEWIRGWVMAVTLDENGDYLRMEPFLDHLKFDALVDMQINHDGAIYILEYGTNWFSKNSNAKLVRIEYQEGNRDPVAEISVENKYGATPLTVELTAKKSIDHDKEDLLKFKWKIEGNDLEGETIQYTFDKAGVHDVELVVTDNQGGRGVATTQVYAGNTPPAVVIETLSNRSFYWDHTVLDYDIKISDEEDPHIDQEQVNISFGYVPRGKDVAVILRSGGDASRSLQLKGEQLLGSLDCKACHSMDKISVGPSYKAIAERYADQQDKVQELSTKIIEGGTGVWGSRYMTPHPELSVEDAAEMVNYILSLSKADESGRFPLKDEIILTSHLGQGKEGSYLLHASYTDQGANGIEPLESRAHITLENPLVQAEDFDRGNIRIGTSTTNEFYGYARATHGGFMQFNRIDLTHIKTLRYRIQSLKPGLIELRLGETDGPVVSSVTVLGNGGDPWSEIVAPVDPTTGVHDLYFVFTSPQGKKEQLFNIDWIYFSNGEEQNF